MKSTAIACILLTVIAIISVVPLLEGGSPEGSNEAPLTNQDVIKLSKAGLSEAAIIQKINQAARVNFLVDPSNLTVLQREGVTPSVTATMSRKASIQAREDAIRDYAAKQPKLTVELETPTGTVELKGLDGYKSELHASRSLLFSTALAIKGAKAPQTISSTRPTVVITTIGPLEDSSTLFLVRLNSRKDERLYKMGSIRQIGRGDNVPSEDIQVQVDVDHQSMLVWRLTPKVDLKPGEYAVMIFDFEMEDWKIFDFGVS